MKRLIVLLLSIVAVAGCSNCAGKKGATPEQIHRLDKSVAIVSASSLGHGCPVGGYIFTAAHVVDGTSAVNWSDQYGNSGRAKVAGVNNAGDLARMIADKHGDKPIQNALLLEAPKVGDKVYWFEYDWRTVENVMRESFRTATVLRIIANHIVLDEAPISGASGGCLFVEGGAVAGIMIFSLSTLDDKGAGMAIRILPEDVT